MKILFIGESSVWSQIALSYLSLQSESITSIIWSKGMPLSDVMHRWRGDWIFSFKSDLILSSEQLERAKRGAINFHPAPPWYRGIGGYWHAIQKKEKIFGCTCHYMDEKIDHGPIIEVRLFEIYSDEKLEQLYLRTAQFCLEQFKHIINSVLCGIKPSPINKKWQGRLYTSVELPKEYFETVQSCNNLPLLRHKNGVLTINYYKAEERGMYFPTDT